LPARAAESTRRAWAGEWRLEFTPRFCPETLAQVHKAIAAVAEDDDLDIDPALAACVRTRSRRLLALVVTGRCARRTTSARSRDL
jgi:hypothetical protein